MNVLFVCLGNICRSPMAAGIMARVHARRGITGSVDSAGTEDWHSGEPADPRAISVAAAGGLDISAHRGRQICPEDFRRFDVIVAMDRENERVLRAMAPADAAYKIRRFRAPGSVSVELDVRDPYEGTREDFLEVFELLEGACERMAGEIQPGLRLEPLSPATLGEVCRVSREIFPKLGVFERPSLAFRLSLRPTSLVARAAFWAMRVTAPRYWVAIDSASGRVAGVTGIFESYADRHEASWGGWTFVAPDQRGRGLGRSLMGFVVDTARRDGKRCCRTYTSTDPNEAAAIRIHLSLGGVPTKTERYWFSREQRIYGEIRFD